MTLRTLNGHLLSMEEERVHLQMHSKAKEKVADTDCLAKFSGSKPGAIDHVPGSRRAYARCVSQRNALCKIPMAIIRTARLCAPAKTPLSNPLA